jgi:hypothetical protein
MIDEWYKTAYVGERGLIEEVVTMLAFGVYDCLLSLSEWQKPII